MFEEQIETIGRNKSEYFENTVSVQNLMQQWLEYKKLFVKKSTFCCYQRIVTKILMPYLKDIRMNDINDELLNELLFQLIHSYHSKTVTDIIVIVNQILQFAYERGYIRNQLKLHCKITKKKPLPEVLSHEEQQKLTNFLISDSDSSKLGVLICLYTGIRLGEICGLQWKDINIQSGIIKIKRTIQRISNSKGKTEILIDTPKTASSAREIPIPEILIPYLEKHMSATDAYVTTGTEKYTQPRTYQLRLKAYLRCCELPDYHFHTLRHTFATRAIELGFDPKSLSEILGHFDVKTTLALYVHPSMELKQKEMNKFSFL
ncbi:MAG: site-specific integrase [Clostridia bacterium]|nr:site-specific integrase [Clostridia bacterium]